MVLENVKAKFKTYSSAIDPASSSSGSSRGSMQIVNISNSSTQSYMDLEWLRIRHKDHPL